MRRHKRRTATGRSRRRGRHYGRARLETAASRGELEPFSGETSLFLKPGYRFRVVDALLTNFHLPESTLLMLVCAFVGYAPVMAAYRHAVRERYRFFSYGDAMFAEKADHDSEPPVRACARAGDCHVRESTAREHVGANTG